MLLAEDTPTTSTTAPAPADAATTSTSHFAGFDVFVILFTILILIAIIRSVAAPKKNKFAIGFGVVSLIVFLIMDAVMVLNWFGMLNG